MGKTLLELLNTFKFEDRANPRNVSSNMIKPKPDDKFAVNVKQSKEWLLATPKLYGTDYGRIMLGGKVDTRKSNKKLAKLAGKVVDGIGLGKVKIGGTSLNKLVTQVHPEFPSDLMDDYDNPRKTRESLYSDLYNGRVNNSKTAVGNFLKSYKTPTQIKEAILPSLVAGASSLILGGISNFTTKKLGVGKDKIDPPSKQFNFKSGVNFPSDMIEKDNRFAARNQAQLARTKDFETLYDESNKLEGIYLGNVDTKNGYKFKDFYKFKYNEIGKDVYFNSKLYEIDDNGKAYELNLKNSRFLKSDNIKIYLDDLTYGLNQTNGSNDTNLIKIQKSSLGGYTIKSTTSKTYRTFYDYKEYYSKTNSKPENDLGANIIGAPADSGFGLYRPLSKTNLYKVSGDAPKTITLSTNSDIKYVQNYAAGDLTYENLYDDTKTSPDNGGISFKLGSSDENFLEYDLESGDITNTVNNEIIGTQLYTSDITYDDAIREAGYTQDTSTNTELTIPSDFLKDPIAKKYTNNGIGRHVDNKNISKTEKRWWGNKNEPALYAMTRALKADVLVNNNEDIVVVKIGEFNFLATLTSFNDKINSNWDSVKPVGSGLNFYLFNNWERSLSFDLTLYSEDLEETPAVWERANSLNKYTMGIPSGKGAAYGVYGQIVTLKIGNLIDETGFLNSVSVTVDDTHPWEIAEGTQLPFVCKLSIDFQVVTNVEGKDYNFYNKSKQGAAAAPPKQPKIDETPKETKKKSELPKLEKMNIKNLPDTTRYVPTGASSSDYAQRAQVLKKSGILKG